MPTFGQRRNARWEAARPGEFRPQAEFRPQGLPAWVLGPLRAAQSGGLGRLVRHRPILIGQKNQADFTNIMVVSNSQEIIVILFCAEKS